MSDDRFKSTAPVSFDEKIELVSLLAEKSGIPRRSAPAISRRTLNHPVPLTSAQERLWFLEQLEPGNPAYHIVRAERLIGDLEISAFTKSVLEIVRRHEILRTTFASADGHPVQIIRDLEHPLQTPSLTESPRDQATAVRLIDLTNYPEDSRFCEAKKIAETRSKQTFDFVAGPMFRVDLIRLDQTEHLMLFVVHQIVFDWRSHALFSQELSKLYAAFCANRRPELPAIEVQFADFAAWQREQLREDALTSALAYWKNQLEDAPSVLELPYDHVPPPIQRFFGARQAFELSEEVAEQLTDVGRRRGVTLFVVLLTAFKILLQRYSGQDDIVVGCPVTTRELPQTENLIGFFVNTLPLRTDLSDNPTSTQLLSRVQTGFTRALAYQQLPFETLIDELHLPRILNREPLFQVMFIFQDTPLPRLELNGIQSISAPVDTGTSKFDVTLTLAPRQRRLAGFFEYRTDLFDQSTTERMVKHFGTVLEGIVADPDRTITALQILTEPELQQLLHEWNDTSADYPKDKCIHQLFEEQVERTPHKVALEFDGQEITYRELNRRANQLANYLIDVGTGPEELVGICVERSVEMMVGLLAVLKSGGAYVPLDPGYPKERLRFMVQDAQLSVLLTTQTLVADRELMIEDGDTQFLRRGSGQASSLGPRLKVVCLDRDWPLIVQQKDDNPKQAVTSKNLAYVIYTSGSIGKPKGVQIAHRSVINCLHSLGERLAFTERDVLLAVTTSSFDISVLELFLPLTLGGKVVVASRDEAVDGSELTRRLKDVSATAMQATPSTWRLLIEAGWEGSPRFKILCGGEAMPRDLAQALLTRGEVWNLYGPTESTIWSTIHKVGSGEGPVPIGRPIANTKIYILDSHLQPVPIGVHGDLYIGGDGLARGYWNNPELTAEKFIPDPFSDEANAELYRTGDRARYRSDGTIEFLGRTDNQVKIRGHRIELSEIESVLMQHSAVNQTVVVAFDEFASDSDNPQSKIENPKSLAAYVVPAQPSAVSVSDLRKFLQEKLPDYMVPASFIFLNALPQTANGKLDRNALPPPDGARPLLDHGFVEPRTEIEELVAQIWREVLRRDKVGVYDNFFDLGGHSLLATRIVARLQSTFHVDLALRKLFELPTVAGLAQHIDELRHSGAGTAVAPVVPVSRNQPLPLSFSQRRLWYLQKVDANLSAYNIPACYRIKGDLNIGALEQALNGLIARHEVFRSAIFERSGEPHQEIVPTLQFDLPVLDLSRLPDVQAETEAKRLASEDAHQLHVLDKPPLMRAKLVKLADTDHVFILNFHHSIADGSSLAIFYRELSSLYSSALEKKEASLPQLPVQYADYAVWQHKWLDSDASNTQLAYWKRQLAGLPVQVEIPTDFDRPAIPAYRGARLTKALSEELTESLRTFSRKQGATTFMTLFATFNILLSRISGQDDIIIGSTIAGRNHPETDGLIGFFINALPLRINLSCNPKFTTLLHHVREVCLDAYTNQEVPFEKIIEELKPPRHRGRNPLFDILFNIADSAERILALPGCEVTKFSHGEPGAKFDVVLQAPEVDGKIELVIVYNADLFRESRIDLLLEQFAFLLEQLINNPEQAISQLSLVSESSRAALPDPTEALDASWAGAIHEHLAKQAQRSPEKLAIVDPEQSWTYSEINGCANRLANQLIAAQIQPKDTVAIYAQRNSSLVIAMLGILRAGTSFLILDPAYPAARNIDYLRIARPKGWLQLTRSDELPQELLSYLDSLDLRCRMTIPAPKSDLLQALSALADCKLEISIDANDSAYIAFTSGSTGEPKGVLCRHGPVTHFLPWQKDNFELTENDRFAMLSGLAYSHLHRDVFTAIYLGGTIYIPTASEARSPDRLIPWFQQNEITILHLTPALCELLLTAAATPLPSVRRVFFGGDVLTLDEVDRVRRLAPNATIGSFYGATETQRAVGYYEIPADFAGESHEINRPIPLGRGIKDVQLLVLNRAGQLAGVGEIGELYVRSHHLAQGYLNDETRTREVFIKNPFTNDLEDRLYKTGELARYLPDGNVEWAGRNDRRVNIRGFRVELEEIEAVLRRHPAVKNAAVVLQEVESYHSGVSENPKSKIQNQKFSESDNPKPVLSKVEVSKIQKPKSDSRLVAYIVSAEENSQSLSDLLYAYVNAGLPGYMVPAYFITVTSLPLNPNGKVDYRALPAVRFSAHTTAEAPRNEIEAKLQAIFAEVLERSDIGMNDNFFRIGGHSLLAARAAARIGDAFGVGLELSVFLETPTVRGLATEIASVFPTGQTTTESDKDQREEFDL
jgi:amino acid adenylation domain-containing protein